MKHTSVRLPEASYNRLRARAERSGHSTAFYIRAAINLYLDDWPTDEALDLSPPGQTVAAPPDAGDSFPTDEEYLAELDALFGPADARGRKEEYHEPSAIADMVDNVITDAITNFTDAGAEADEDELRPSTERIESHAEPAETGQRKTPFKETNLKTGTDDNPAGGRAGTPSSRRPGFQCPPSLFNWRRAQAYGRLRPCAEAARPGDSR